MLNLCLFSSFVWFICLFLLYILLSKQNSLYILDAILLFFLTKQKLTVYSRIVLTQGSWSLKIVCEDQLWLSLVKDQLCL